MVLHFRNIFTHFNYWNLYVNFSKNKYLQEKLENQKTLKEIMDRYSFCLKENIELKKLVDLYENEKYSKIDTFSVCGGEIKKDPIYKGKKALIGDYLSSSYTNTEKVLRSLGFSVEIVPTVNDIVEKIKYGEHYDIIFRIIFINMGLEKNA